MQAESIDIGQFVVAGQSVGRLYATDAVEVVVPLSDANAVLIPGLWELKAGDGDRRVVARVIAEYGDRSYAWEGYVDRAEASPGPTDAHHQRHCTRPESLYERHPSRSGRRGSWPAPSRGQIRRSAN